MISKIKIKPLSVNLSWKGKRYKTGEYKAYEQELMLKLPNIDIPDGDLSIYLEFGFSNRAADWDNPIKPFVDVLQKKYGFDDKRIYEAVTKKKIVPKRLEYISFEIKALPQEETLKKTRVEGLF